MKGSVLSKRALDPESPYSEFVQKVRVKISSDHENATQPEEVAKTIVQAILTEKPEFRYVVGSDALNIGSKKKYVILRVPKDDNTKCQTIVLHVVNCSCS